MGFIQEQKGGLSRGAGHRLGEVRRRSSEGVSPAEMVQDALDLRGFGDEADDSHR
jgi:hypothetical protein